MATLTRRRTVDLVPYITSPGGRVSAFVSDVGVFEKGEDGTFVLTAVPAGPGSIEERVGAVRSLCGWELTVARSLTELEAPAASDIEALRRWDPLGRFLRPDA
jgi:acyl CoA:acetate/3-ketoacid CoA transferase beta subunit